MAVKIGTRFRSVYADSNCLWRVVSKEGRLWLAQVVEDEDYAGVQQGFTTGQIEGAVKSAKNFGRLMDDHEKFYSELPIGSIVHYDNGFAQFVRARRVDGPPRKRLVPIGLVGNWREYDLPRVQPDGTWGGGTSHVKWIADGEAFEPNYTSIWEAMDASRREWSMRIITNTGHLNEIGRARHAELPYQAPFDPTTEPLIDISPPAQLTPQQEERARLERRRVQIAEIVSERPDTIADYLTQLSQIIRLTR